MSDKAELLGQQKELQQAYSRVFEGKDGLLVKKDLERVCFKNFTTINESPYLTAFNEGQRAVLLHIETMQRMNLFVQGKEENGQS